MEVSDVRVVADSQLDDDKSMGKSIPAASSGVFGIRFLRAARARTTSCPGHPKKRGVVEAASVVYSREEFPP